MRQQGLFNILDLCPGGEHFYTEENRSSLLAHFNETSAIAEKWRAEGNEEYARECEEIASSYATELGESLMRYLFAGGDQPGAEFYDKKWEDMARRSLTA
jgi:uridine phosphorylase